MGNYRLESGCQSHFSGEALVELIRSFLYAGNTSDYSITDDRFCNRPMSDACTSYVRYKFYALRSRRKIKRRTSNVERTLYVLDGRLNVERY